MKMLLPLQGIPVMIPLHPKASLRLPLGYVHPGPSGRLNSEKYNDMTITSHCIRGTIIAHTFYIYTRARICPYPFMSRMMHYNSLQVPKTSDI